MEVLDQPDVLISPARKHAKQRCSKIVLVLVKLLTGKDWGIKVVLEPDVLPQIRKIAVAHLAVKTKGLIQYLLRNSGTEFVAVDDHAFFAVGAQLAGYHF